jgi:hypothetical protein
MTDRRTLLDINGNKTNPWGDYNLEVLRGNIPGHTMVNIRGHDETVTSGGPSGLSPGFGTNDYVFDQSAIFATPAVVEVASTDDTKDDIGNVGALTARVVGLDASGNAQTDDVILTGQTEVPTVKLFSAVFQLTVLTTGSENGNSGTLWVGTGTFTAGVPAVRMLSMQAGHNISHSAYYVVPTGKTFYPRQLIATIGGSQKDVEVQIRTSTDGSQWYTQGTFGLEAGDFTTPIIALPGLVTGTHVSLWTIGPAAQTADISGIIAGELIDN